MFRLIVILIASSSIIPIDSHPEPRSKNLESTYKADDSLNKVINDADSKVTEIYTTENAVSPEVKNMLAQEKPEDLIDSIAKTILEHAKTNSKPQSRRNNGQDSVQPEIVHFESKRPSVMLKMNTTSLVDMLANALKSKTVDSYVQYYTRRAAQAFNVIQQKIEEDDSKNRQ